MSQQYAPNTTQFKLSRTIAPFHEEEMEPEPLALRPSHVEVAAPGARGTVMLKAPLAEVPETKRAPMIIEQDQSLVETTVDLEEGTKRRNRELHEKLSAIEQRGVHWEVRARAPRRRARVSRSSRARRGAASTRPVAPVDVAEERDVGRRAQRHTGRLSGCALDGTTEAHNARQTTASSGRNGWGGARPCCGRRGAPASQPRASLSFLAHRHLGPAVRRFLHSPSPPPTACFATHPSSRRRVRARRHTTRHRARPPTPPPSHVSPSQNTHTAAKPSSSSDGKPCDTLPHVFSRPVCRLPIHRPTTPPPHTP